MFAFHKNETLSRSRQSSIDSPLTENRSLTSVPDSISASQCSADSDYTEGMHSPEQRPRAASTRRSSVFNMRSRSNTAASTASSIMSSSHPDLAAYDHGTPGSPNALRHIPSHSRLERINWGWNRGQRLPRWRSRTKTIVFLAKKERNQRVGIYAYVPSCCHCVSNF
jgi:hypothetical protein